MNQERVEYFVVVEKTRGTVGEGKSHDRKAYIAPATWFSVDRKYVLLPKRVNNPFSEEDQKEGKKKAKVLTLAYFDFNGRSSDIEMHQRFQTLPFPLRHGFEEHNLEGEIECDDNDYLFNIIFNPSLHSFP
jgi:hypothetical protein